MLCPECGKSMVDTCADCGVFYDKTEFVVTDLTNSRSDVCFYPLRGA